MCRSFMERLGKLDVGSRVAEQISARDPLARSLGFEGVDDPLGNLKASVEGRDTLTTINARKAGAARQQAARDGESVGPAAHISAIAARKAVGG